MANMLTILFLLAYKVSVVIMTHSKTPVAQKVWREHCSRNGLALNDCNWCRCDTNLQYICTARPCDTVDMFGHFNDAIKEVDVGMEGHGVWRSKETPCQAGVHYAKGELLCVCTEEGMWPSPVCRDVFQVLHDVQPTKFDKPSHQSCEAYKLYQVGCNVCVCPSSKRIDPSHCTKRDCKNDVDITNKKSSDKNNHKYDMVDEIYAACERAKHYQIGCKTCVCLPNNRLLCDNCTSVNNMTFKVQVKSNDKNLCSGKIPGKKFKRDCNICYCDQKDIIYCTVMTCLEADPTISLPKLTYETVKAPIEDLDCVPTTRYNRDCNVCHCFMLDGIKYFGCTMRKCDQNNPSVISQGKNESGSCVDGTQYEKNCLICQCVKENGEKKEFCTANDRCKLEDRKYKSPVPRSLDTMHGYCEPLHTYEQDCNKCRCLTDGKTVGCTSKICSVKLSQEKPIVVEFIPFIQKQNVCPKGHRYKVDCNICHCMSNGNALCTTNMCKSNVVNLLEHYYCFILDI